MAEEAKNKKTGATPLPEGAPGGSGEVLGVLEIRPVIIKLRDGYGKDQVRIALVVPGGEVYYLDDAALRRNSAQAWVKKGVLDALGMSE